MKTWLGLSAGILACALHTGALAQQTPRIDPEVLQRAQEIDRARLQIQERFQVIQQDTQTPDLETGSGYEFNARNELWYGWVNFDQDREQGLLAGRIANLGWREIAGGVRFATGQRDSARIIRCGSATNACALGQEGSPDALVTADGTGTLRIDFARPVSAVTALVAPDRSRDVQAEVFIMEGWSNGDISSVNQGNAVIYDSPERGWTRLTLSGLGGATRDTTAATTAATGTSGQTFDYVIIRGLNANGGAVNAPLILDSLRFADRFGPAPFDALGPRSGGLGDMLEETRRLGPRLTQRAEVLREGGRQEDRIYPVAQQVRMNIDLGRVRAGALRQRDFVQLDLPERASLRSREPSTVPLLAPLGVFRNENPQAGLVETARYMGRENFFHLRFDTPYGPAVISGTRVAVIEPNQPLTPGDLDISTGYDGAFASFSLYGASYSVRLTCDHESVGQPCNDAEALETLLDRLFLFVPEAEG